MRRRNHAGNKRRSDYDINSSNHHENDNVEEGVVDDLAHAATFAMMTMIPSIETSTTFTSLEKSVPGAGNEVKNDSVAAGALEDDGPNDEIDIEESSMESEDEKQTEDEKSENEDDDDDASDVDLAEALARMDQDETIEEEDEQQHPSNKVPRPPKTENELDAYRTPIQELEKHLHFQLSVTPEDETGTSSTSATNSNIVPGEKTRRVDASRLQLAGRIKHFMVLDQTVVVESSASNPHGDATSFSNEKAPLDEGTLLWFRPHEMSTDETIFGGAPESLIPLGRIFEVFGPVSQPLYTIRLASSKSTETKNRERATTASTLHDKVEVVSIRDVTVASSPAILDEKMENINEDAKTLETENLPMDDSAEPEKEQVAVAQEEIARSTSCTAATSVDALPASHDEKDLWGPNGIYTTLLQKNQFVPVYYLRDEAKLIDTGFIMKISRKGCDASNLYDEEVLNTNEMYYSDDEEERQAKNQRRKSKGSSKDQPTISEMQDRNTMYVRSPPLPTGFHHGMANSQGSTTSFPHAPSTTLPQGFHQPSYSNQRPNNVHPIPGVAPRPQPSEIPPAPSRPFPYSQPTTHAPNGGPPPPPPPGCAAPPPPYQYY